MWEQEFPSARGEPGPHLYLPSDFSTSHHQLASRRRTFVELLQERPVWATPRREQLAHDMIFLLPVVHRLLVLLPALEQELVDHAQIRDVPVLLKSCPNGLADILLRDRECVKSSDLWGLSEREHTHGRTRLDVKAYSTVPVAVELEDCRSGLFVLAKCSSCP